MSLTSNLPYPPRWVNAYIYDKLSEYEDIGVDKNQKFNPIFPASPTNIEEVYKEVSQSTGIADPLIMQYDRLMRFRPNSFYPRKREQLLYYVYSTSISNVNNAAIVISQLLDREDAAAQDLNDWCSNNSSKIDAPYNVFFHNIKVHQTEEAKDIMSANSVRKIYVSKLIIEYDYHAKNDSTFK
jgi:hypothetical protein